MSGKTSLPNLVTTHMRIVIAEKNPTGKANVVVKFLTELVRMGFSLAI